MPAVATLIPSPDALKRIVSGKATSAITMPLLNFPQVLSVEPLSISHPNFAAPAALAHLAFTLAPQPDLPSAFSCSHSHRLRLCFRRQFRAGAAMMTSASSGMKPA